MSVEEIIKKKIKHYKECYRLDGELTFETLIAILQGLLMDIQTSGENRK